MCSLLQVHVAFCLDATDTGYVISLSDYENSCRRQTKDFRRCVALCRVMLNRVAVS